MSLLSNTELSDYNNVRDSVLDYVPEAREKWIAAEPKRNIVSMLVGLRNYTEISQKDICDRTGWDKSYVSRLESASTGIPDLITINRFANACNKISGVIICNYDHKNNVVKIVSSSSVDSDSNHIFKRMIGASIEIQELRDSNAA